MTSESLSFIETSLAQDTHSCETSGTVSVYSYLPSVELRSPQFSHFLSLRQALNSTASGLETGRVMCMAWTSDGYALAVGWSLGYAIWSTYGRLGSWSVAGSLAEGYGVEGEKSDSFEDHFMQGVRNLVRRSRSLSLLQSRPDAFSRQFWGPGNLELIMLCPPPVYPKGKSELASLIPFQDRCTNQSMSTAHDEQLFVVPFVKSAVAGCHSPVRFSLLGCRNGVLIYLTHVG